MVDPDGTDDIVRAGTTLCVAWARDRDGRRWAKEYFDSIPSQSDQRAILHLCGLLATEGRIANREHFHHVEDQIWGLKKFQIRLSTFRHRNIWYLAHGFTKKQDRWPKAEIERAIRLRNEQLSRVG